MLKHKIYILYLVLIIAVILFFKFRLGTLKFRRCHSRSTFKQVMECWHAINTG